MDTATRDRYKRLIKRAIKNDEPTDQLKKEIASHSNLNEFYGLECEALEDLGQSCKF